MSVQRFLGSLLLLLVMSLVKATAQIPLSVKINGLEPEQEENVRLFLSLEQQKQSELLSPGRMQRLHKKAPQEISKALQPFGFYQPTITSRFSQSDDQVWHFEYDVNPGKAITIGVFDFQLNGAASEDEAFIDLLKKNKLGAGNIFNHANYEGLKSELAQLAAERGYVNAKFSKRQVEIDLLNYQANVYLHFSSGPRYRFGEVNFSQAILEQTLLQKYVPFERGSPFSFNTLIELQQGLNDSDYFKLVEVTTGEANADSLEIPVEVLLKPRKPHRYTLGLGYGTDTGARAQAGWLMPRINLQGHRLETHLKVSELGYDLGAQYRFPILNPRTDQIIFSVGEVNEKTDTSESTIDTLSVSLNHLRGLWRENISLTYQQEDFTIADTQDSTSLLMPGINWSRIWGREFWGNQIVRAFDGIRLDIGIRTASDSFVSDVSFSQLQLSAKAIHRFNQQHRVITRFRLGRIETDEFERLPSSVRFFSGGAQSVRGFRYQSLGALDEDGEVIGGQYLVEGSIEYEYSFNSRWGMALFMDTGNAMTNIDDPLEQGAGIGLRWQSPIGPLRVDLASALSLEGDPWRLHINIGPDL